MIVSILGIAMARSGRVVDQAQLHLAGAGFPQFKMGLVLAFMMLAGFESATTPGEEALSMARERLFPPFFSSIHPVNETPSRALLVMASAMDYLMQIASFGFLGGYLSVCVAAPFYLARRHALTAVQLLVAMITYWSSARCSF